MPVHRMKASTRSMRSADSISASTPRQWSRIDRRRLKVGDGLKDGARQPKGGFGPLIGADRSQRIVGPAAKHLTQSIRELGRIDVADVGHQALLGERLDPGAEQLVDQFIVQSRLRVSHSFSALNTAPCRARGSDCAPLAADRPSTKASNMGSACERVVSGQECCLVGERPSWPAKTRAGGPPRLQLRRPRKRSGSPKRTRRQARAPSRSRPNLSEPGEEPT